jgi:mRNA deadenylase 3'-5' endonuclease subunit Ccr4
MMDAIFGAIFSGPIKAIPSAPPLVETSTQWQRPSISSTTSLPLKLMSWNLLAPCYNRRNSGRESEESWRARAAEQMLYAAASDADIIGLQEFWLETAHVQLWTEWAKEHRYTMHLVPRTDGKRDGCAMLVRMPSSACRFSAYTFNDWGSRIVQACDLTLEGIGPLTLLQTHLTFPHASASHARSKNTHASPVPSLSLRRAAQNVTQNAEAGHPRVGETDLRSRSPRPERLTPQASVIHGNLCTRA